MGAHRVPKASPKGFKIDEKALSNRYLQKGLKKTSKMMISRTPGCGSSVVNNNKITVVMFCVGSLLGFLLEVFWEPKWKPKA